MKINGKQKSFIKMFYIFLNLSLIFQIIICDLIDTQFPIVFIHKKSDSNSRDNENINGSYFGYSLSVNQESDKNIILIGAPRFNSAKYSRIERTGAVFRCDWSERNRRDGDEICTELDFKTINQFRFVPTQDMSLGYSLTTNTNTFVTCGHLWTDTKYRLTPTPLGKCFQIDNQGKILKSFGPRSEELVTGEDGPGKSKGRPWNSHIMYGFSSFGLQTEDTVLIGGPGYLDFSGTILKRDLDSNNGQDQKLLLEKLSNVPEDSYSYPKINSYLGYSVTTGFFDRNTEYAVMSAPRHNMFTGRVLIYPLGDLFTTTSKKSFAESLIILDGLPNDLGEYFGASLLTLDINGDKFIDLVVGAPLYSNKTFAEVGRVYVFLMNEEGNQVKPPVHIYGHKSYSRFGTALSAIDINLDEFNDVIIGAPQEQNSDGSLGAVYVYLGSRNGLNSRTYMRIGAQNIKNQALNGFGISIFSGVDFDINGYNDIIIGSYLSENAVLLRTKPTAKLEIFRVTFKPNKIRLTEKNGMCDNNQLSCFKVEYCIKYEGKRVREKQSAFVSLEVTDSKLRVSEDRVWINNNAKFEQKTVDLSVNQPNCNTKDRAFNLFLNDQDKFTDIITPIEFKLTVQLSEHPTDKFCKNCAIASTFTTFANIEFEHGCQTRTCVSRLTLNSVLKYNGQTIKKTLIEGQHDTINIDITVSNSGEASINTILVIRMKPILLELTNSIDANRCTQYKNESSYRCEVSKILQKNRKEQLNLYFDVSRIPSNHLDIDLKLETKSNVSNKPSELAQNMKLEIIKEANLAIVSEKANSYSYSDKQIRVTFQIDYSLVKSGPSTIDKAFLIIKLPTDVIDLDSESKSLCEIISTGYRYSYSKSIVNKTLEMECNSTPDYCSKYMCPLLAFNSGEYSEQYTLSLALIPSYIKNLDFTTIEFKLDSEIKIDDKTDIMSKATTSLTLAREATKTLDAKTEPWILFVSSGIGVFALIIAIIILIKIGFFRRKKLEEIGKIKQRMSMKPNMIDINIEDLTEQELNQMEN